jgi:hypothetical protein
MQDIRKPYTRSRSSNDLQSRVERFEAARYRQEDYDEEPVHIPVRKERRDIHEMDMYPRRNAEDLYDEEYDDEENIPRKNSRPRSLRKKSSLGTFLFIIGMIILVVGVTLYTYVFDSATITIVPKYKDVTDVGKTFLFSKQGVDTYAIPYVVESTSLSKSKTLTLSESRKVEAKASGKAIIYNNYDSSPQKLIKNTRFESSQGKIYRINQSVEVPGKKGGVPGSIEVTLYADSNGADYNVDKTTFTIPGFKGTPRESAFYAKSKDSITGGSSGTMSLASLSDLNAAKDSLAVELGKSIQTDIQKIRKDGYTPMYSAVEVVYEDNEDEILKGITGVYKVTATANLMLADAPKLAEAIAKTFGDYDGQLVRLTYTDTLNYTRKQTDHVLGTSTISVLVEGKPRVVWQSNSDAIKELVQGKKRDEFKPLMKTINSIESAEISFSPMWLSRFPNEPTKLIVTESLPKR